MDRQLTNAVKPLRELRILVVDDNADCAESMCLLLRLFGHEVKAARDGRLALELARATQPDVILLDIGLPGMDGYEVCRRLKTEPRDKVPFLIAVTGYGREEDRTHSAQSGFDLHLLKPVDPTDLQDLLQHHAATLR